MEEIMTVLRKIEILYLIYTLLSFVAKNHQSRNHIINVQRCSITLLLFSLVLITLVKQPIFQYRTVAVFNLVIDLVTLLARLP